MTTPTGRSSVRHAWRSIVPPRRSRSLALAVSGLLGLLASNPEVAQAADLTWDPTGEPTSPAGGDGIWNLSNVFWSDGSADSVWTSDLTSNTAVFSGTAGTVTLDESLSALGLKFSTTGYTIATGANTLTLGTGGIDASSLTSGTTTISGLLALGASQTWSVGSGATLTSSAVISGSGGLTKAGSGTLTLSGTNTYTGTTTISEGTVSISAVANLGASSAAVALDGGVLEVTFPNSTRMDNTHVFTVGSSGGTIKINSPTSGTPTFSINNGTAERLTGSGTLTVKGNGTLGIAGSGASVLYVNAANTTFTGNVVLQEGGILEYANANAVGTTAAFTINDKGMLSTAGYTISRNVTVNDGGVLAFQNNNNGVFSGGITLNGAATVRVQDWWGTAVRNGSITGVISGAGSLTANSGTGTGGMVTINNANTYAGGTTVTGAILRTNIGGNNAAIGNVTPFGSGAVTVGSNGQLRLGTNPGNRNNSTFNIANNTTLNGGTLYAEDGLQRLTGSLVVESSGGTLGSTYNIGSGDGAKGLYLDGVVSGSGSLTVQHTRIGTNQNYNTSFVAFTNNSNTYSGTITVNQNTTTTEGGVYLGINGSTALANATVNLSANINGTNLKFGSSPIVFNTGLGTATLGALSGSGNVVLTGYNQSTHVYGSDSIALTVGNNNGTTTYSGIMSGDGSLTKSGSGAFTLSGANTYTGLTTISAGTLALASTGSIANSSLISVSSGTTFDVSAVSGYTIEASQTLKGTGTVVGDVTVSGTFAPGSSPGTLTVTGNLTLAGITEMEIGSASSYDQAIVSGTLTYGGALNIVEYNGYNMAQAGSYNLFDSAAVSGVFSSVSVAGTALLSTADGFSSTFGGFRYTFTNADGMLTVAASAIPEPSTYAAIVGALALAGVVWQRRRRAGAQAQG